ncbi:hypothetical protein TrispH2_002946 [Trichoplax sp. H2]|nr:hypothetical protein TrispH2_002946 [Trichoplax sp. H2]|eukprot:RDD45061.1 hypothetical protein TrispH2_002946 [Trichoplax sp. H2]
MAGTIDVATSNLSSYYQSLDISQQFQYDRKLTPSKEERLPDPFTLKNWKRDINLLPNVAWLDIYKYLVDTTSEFTQDTVKAYKSLKAYSYFLCGHVQDIYYHDIEVECQFCFVKSKILSSTLQGKKAEFYHAWICTNKKSGSILTANCTCKSGLGSACDHVAAVLFKLLAYFQLELHTTTSSSKLSTWNQSKTHTSPRPLKKICFKRPKRSDLLPYSTHTDGVKDTKMNISYADPTAGAAGISEIQLTALKVAAPNAAIFTSFTTNRVHFGIPNGSQGKRIIQHDWSSIPRPITSLYDPEKAKLNSRDLRTISYHAFEEYKKLYTQNSYDKLCAVTVFPKRSPLWKVHCAGRIIASMFHRIAHSINNPNRALIKCIMQYKLEYDDAAVIYSKQMTDSALNCYLVTMRKNHGNFTLKATGLHINSKFPQFAASPDGIIHCECHGKGALEVICPYKYKEGLTNWYKDKDCPISESKLLKENHPYFYQVQGLLLVCELDYCDFFIWTQGNNAGDKIIIRVWRNDGFIEKLLPSLNQVFKNAILPEIVSRKQDRKSS